MSSELQNYEFTQTKRTIGSILLDSGKLGPEDADRIIRAQQEFNLRFGDAAVKLGLVTEEDIQQVLSHQFDYVCLSKDDESIDPSVVAAFQAFGDEIEVLRALRSQLSLRWFAEKKSLVVSAPVTRQGTSFISANLAVMFAQTGQKTLLIDANMRTPVINKLFKCSNKQGLSDILVNRAGTEVIQRVPAFQSLSVLTAGTIPPNPLELLGHSRFSRLMERLEPNFDVIIVDTPPMLKFSDAQTIASVVGGAAIVIKKGAATHSNLKSAKSLLMTANCEPLGVVLNNFKR